MRCDCIESLNERLKIKGYMLKTSYIEIGHSLVLMPDLPIVRLDGKKLKANDVRGVTTRFCPFCGKRYSEEVEE